MINTQRGETQREREREREREMESTCGNHTKDGSLPDGEEKQLQKHIPFHVIRKIHMQIINQ